MTGSLGCARCGSCCDPVHFSRAEHEDVARWSAKALDGVPDPRTDDGWAYWREHDWAEDRRDLAVRLYRPDGPRRENADFISAHWTPAEDGETCICDAFDRDARLCMMQDSKPPVCRDYPWYGREPSGTTLSPQCSFLLDVPPADRPTGARPLIPLTVV